MDVSVLGLGQMGSAIAERVIDAGHTVRVWNRSSGKAGSLVEKGAIELASPDEAWQSDVCITMLADSKAFLDVALASPGGLAIESGAAGKTLIDMSTVSAESSRQVAESAISNGIKYLRAPVSGNPGVVRSGNLTIVVSGDRTDYAGAEGLLRDIGPNIFYAGKDEAARIVKLALNLMIAGTAELLAECVALSEAHGVDRAALLEIVSASAVGSPFVKYKAGPLVADDYTSTFSTRLMRKDMDLILAAASSGGVPLPVTGVVQQLLQACISTGLGDLDFMALLIRLKREAGQVIAAD
ncbi:6-phosphogluconate dehydrogenase (plasmid) [Rhodococcus opacus]|uniref:6-phosphogluconate dehydrogenase n=1 Tax=Rhodococcus opacus TaxID=37919 RepID=A0A1B1KI62_RHOOP|nr:6-phosphogluconate dehydrogenase [Rhodococcus opacus]ANS32395.1 6-phosphogluconate dehydrogenase [Rhodococcus opacus]